MNPTPETCAACRHYRPFDHSDSGSCRRYPQALNVKADYGCGEHSPRIALPAAAESVTPPPAPDPKPGKRRR